MFGSNNWGQLGLGTKTTVNKPTCVKGTTFSVSVFPWNWATFTLLPRVEATSGNSIYTPGTRLG